MLTSPRSPLSNQPSVSRYRGCRLPHATAGRIDAVIDTATGRPFPPVGPCTYVHVRLSTNGAGVVMIPSCYIYLRRGTFEMYVFFLYIWNSNIPHIQIISQKIELMRQQPV